MTAQFNSFIKLCRAEIIECDDINPEVVFSKYFSVELPFENREEKRREFPDAFAIEALKAFAGDSTSQVVCISGDKGFRGALENTGISRFETIEEFLDSENREWDTRVAEHVLECYSANVERIKDDIEQEFTDSSFVLTDVNGDVEETDIVGLSVDEDPLVLRTDRDSAILETHVQISFRAKVAYDDPAATVYDREDDRTYVFNTINRSIEQTIGFPLEVRVQFDPADEAWCDLSIGKLNNGRDFEISADY